MDKKGLLIKSLEKIMVELLPQMNALIHNNQAPEISIKSDTSPVTQLDLAINEFLEERLAKYSNANFYTEEKSQVWSFPLFVIDPIDGTKEFIKGRAEWTVSIGLLKDESWNGEGWIYNPITKELYTQALEPNFKRSERLQGEVSHTEWESGLYTESKNEAINLKPMGSIAYKLGRLSHGQSDFVVSLKPKNIWDIAAGTILCKSKGYKFYSQGKEVFSVEKYYEPPLIWCREENSSLLLHLFS